MTTLEIVHHHNRQAAKLIDEARMETTLINFHLELAKINAMLLIAEAITASQAQQKERTSE